MQISTTTRHGVLDPAVREFGERRLERFQRFAGDIREVRLIVSVEKFRHTAEITVRLNQHELVSREESTDAHAAIDLAADHLEEQLRRLKDKRVEHRRAAANGEARGANGAAPSAPGDASEDDGGELAAED